MGRCGWVNEWRTEKYPEDGHINILMMMYDTAGGGKEKEENDYTTDRERFSCF